MKMQKHLLCLFLQLLLTLIVLEASKISVLKPHAELMLKAAEKTKLALDATQIYAETAGIIPEPGSNDGSAPMALIGVPYSPITTTLGNPEAKRSTLNPNTSAAITEMLLELGLKPGDTVAVNMSGSFPALNISVLCALDTCQLNGIVISSVGSSSYGANRPEFTYADMEHNLLKENLITNHSVAFSMGGANDMGLEMDAGVKETIRSRLKSYGLAEFSSENYEENLAARIAVYESQKPVKCFINIGGNQMTCKEDEASLWGKAGLLTASDLSGKESGLVPHYLRAKVPVIHLLNIRQLFTDCGLPIDLFPIPAPGEGKLYSRNTYPQGLLLVLSLANLAGLAFHGRRIWRMTHEKIL